jgi:hypothetical protein
MANRDVLLPELGRLTLELKSWLEKGPILDLTDQMFIENHLHVLHLSYATWKKKFLHKTTTGESEKTEP